MHVVINLHILKTNRQTEIKKGNHLHTYILNASRILDLFEFSRLVLIIRTLFLQFQKRPLERIKNKFIFGYISVKPQFCMSSVEEHSTQEMRAAIDIETFYHYNATIFVYKRKDYKNCC